MNRIKFILFPVIVIAASTTFALGVIEFVLPRLNIETIERFVYIRNMPIIQYMYGNYHPTLGFIVYPNLDDVHLQYKNHVNYHVTTNSKGFRGPEWDLAPTRKNILVIGDSYAFGWGVELPDTFSQVLEKSLQVENKHIQVINLGQSGYALDQIINTLNIYQQRFNPIAVIYLFCPNDTAEIPILANDTFDIKNFRKNKSEQEFRRLAWNNNSNVWRWERFWKGSYLNAFYNVYIQPFWQETAHSPTTRQQHYNFNYKNLLPPQPPPSAVPLDTVQRKYLYYGLKTINNIIHQKPLYLMSTGGKKLVHLKDRPRSDRWILRDFAESHNNTRFVDYEGKIRLLNDGKPRYFAIDDHWNKDGHELAAVLLYEALNQDGIPFTPNLFITNAHKMRAPPLPSMKKRILLLHSHIFKNAGTTIDDILKVNFNTGASSIESRDGQFISNEEIITTCLADNSLISLSSHKMRVLPPHHPDLHFIPLVMLRNPLDRLGSMYNFYKGQESTFKQHECKLAQCLPFKDFVKVLIASGNDSSFANLQTQFFLREGLGLAEETWPIAVTNFEATACIGIVEKFDESISLWSKHLVPYFPTIDFSYKKLNVSTNRADTLQARISVLEEALGEELLEVFHRRNHYDYQLYALALDRVERKYRSLEDSGAIAPLHSRDTPSYLQGKAAIGPCPVKYDKVVPPNKNSAARPNLYMNNSGIQAIIPGISRPHEAEYCGAPGAKIIGCGLFNAGDLQPVFIARQGQPVVAILAVTFSDNIINPIIGITIKDRCENIIFAMNTNYSSTKIEISPDQSTTFCCFNFITPPLNQGSYSVTPAISIGSQEQHTVIDIVDSAVIFYIPAMVNPRLPGVLYIQDFTYTNSDGSTGGIAKDNSSLINILLSIFAPFTRKISYLFGRIKIFHKI